MARKLGLALALTIAAPLVLLATAASAEKGEGGKGGDSRGGGGGGAPLPALGVTLLGQAVGAGGLYAVWRRRRASKQEAGQQASTTRLTSR